MIKLIATDIDGTLFNTQGEISPLTKASIMAAHEQGIILMLASGRSIHGLKALALHNGLPLNHMVLVGCNGAVVADGEKEKIIFEEPIKLDLAKKLIENLRTHPVTQMIPEGHYLFVEEKNGYLVDFESETENLTKKVLNDLTQIDFPPTKIILTAEPDKQFQTQKTLIAQFGHEANFVMSGSVYIDVMAVGIDKGAALKHYCELKGILPSEVIAFGDNYNDVGMIAYAGVSVAMANAVDELKAKAKYITLSNDDDGIAVFLDQYLSK